MSDMVLLLSVVGVAAAVVMLIKGVQLYLCSHNRHTWMKVMTDRKQASVYACYYCGTIDVRKDRQRP